MADLSLQLRQGAGRIDTQHASFTTGDSRVLNWLSIRCAGKKWPPRSSMRRRASLLSRSRKTKRRSGAACPQLVTVAALERRAGQHDTGLAGQFVGQRGQPPSPVGIGQRLALRHLLAARIAVEVVTFDPVAPRADATAVATVDLPQPATPHENQRREWVSHEQKPANARAAAR